MEIKILEENKILEDDSILNLYIDESLELLSKNILDYKMLNRIIEIINALKENKENHPKIKLIIYKMCLFLDNKLLLYNKSNQNIKDDLYKVLEALVLLLYIIIYNIKESEKIIIFFRANSSQFIKIIIKLLTKFKDDFNYHEIILSNYILNICFDEIKEKIYSYKNEELIQIYQNEIYAEMLNIFPASNERFRFGKKYKEFIKNILELKLDYYIMNLKGDNSDIFCRNLIPLLISHPDFNFLEFFSFIINKHIEIIRKNYNNELTSLFRADDFTNDIIKNLIMIFGNDAFINSFYFILPKEYLSNNDIEFDLNKFEYFLDNFLNNLIKSLPYIIRVLLKLIYNIIQNLSDEEKNFNVIYTVLIFNFFISPSTLNLFDISMVKYKSLRQLSRILRNLFFGKEFDSSDKLSYFNYKIKIFHTQINEKFIILLNDIDIDKNKDDINNKIKKLLINVKYDKSKIYDNAYNSIFLPSFCYQFYWGNICNSIKNITPNK